MLGSRWIRTLAAAAVGIAVGMAGSVASGVTTAASASPAIVLPAHVFEPYASPSTNLLSKAQASGAYYLTLDFLQTNAPGSCTVYWNGSTSTPLSTYTASIAALQAAGGQVVPSFGGSAADSEDTELADSCQSVSAIAADYETVITTYNVTRLDFDVEEDSLNNYAGIDRRNKAIAMVESWAAQNGRTIQFIYTIPTNTTGPDQGGTYVLQNAVQNGAQISIVDLETFDYYDNLPHEMADNTETSAQTLFDRLHLLYPTKSPSQLWSMIGVCEDIGSRGSGRDDFGAAETFTLQDAKTVEAWAASKGMAELTFWNLSGDPERDDRLRVQPRLRAVQHVDAAGLQLRCGPVDRHGVVGRSAGREHAFGVVLEPVVLHSDRPVRQ
jgi:hypothetical protein